MVISYDVDFVSDPNVTTLAKDSPQMRKGQLYCVGAVF